jgi:hypothetical protein
MDTTTTTTTAITTFLPERVLRKAGSERSKLTTTTLEEVRDHLRLLAQKQEPLDIERSPSQFHLSFEGGKVEGWFIDAPNDKFVLTRNAYNALAGEVLPRSGGNFLLEQAALGIGGEKLATMSWAGFARRGGNETPRMFRTVNAKMDGKVVRAIRSVHSQSYGTYDNLRFVEDLLAHTDMGEARVLQYLLTDSAMRLRFLSTDDEVQLRVPVPMMEAWNSEVGKKRVSVNAGLWRLVCTNGMAAAEVTHAYNWRHYGEAERIARGVENAARETVNRASGLLDAYHRALDTSIDDAFEWMRQSMEADFGASTIAAAQAGLKDPTTTEGGSLASVVDAVALIAQRDEYDLFQQADLEALSVRLLQRGLAEARDGRIAIA